MDMHGSARIVTREDALEMDHAIIAARLDTAKESSIGILSIVRVAVSICHYTRINTL